MAETQTAYRQIMKATSIFGGVQVFQILIGIARSKFIATLLGPEGMGVAGLFQVTIGMVAGLTNFGLSSSAVKNVAAAHADENQTELNRVTAVFRRLIWFSGLLGALITLIFSSYLSKITFGNKNYTWTFAVLSITLLIDQITNYNSVLLRGTRKINYLAQSSIIGSVIGLIATIPLYYLYGIQGVVPAIVITSLIALGLSWYFASKLSVKSTSIGWKETYKEGKGMMYMGFLISFSGIITMAVSYFIRIYIRNNGSIEDVGLYNAGFAIINTYVGMIFTAMSIDYFPRLSAVANVPEEYNKTINQQAEIAILILAPMLLVFITFIKWIILVLYSTSFLPIQNMILFAAIGMLFKALSWAIAFIFLAKSANKLFFWNELITNFYMLLLNLFGYYYFGLTGLGASFLITYILYCLQVYIIARQLFEYKLSHGLIRIFFTQLLLASICFVVIMSVKEIYAYVMGSLLVMVSMAFSLIVLNKKIDISAYLKRT